MFAGVISGLRSLTWGGGFPLDMMHLLYGGEEAPIHIECPDVLVSCPFCSPQPKQVKVNAGEDLQFSPQLKFSRLMKVVE